MTADETEIYNFLRDYPNLFISVTEISKRLGHRKRFDHDRTWARPILRRMELDGVVEANPFGEYKAKLKANDTSFFKVAINVPGISLGDTTIITLDDIDDGKSRS